MRKSIKPDEQCCLFLRHIASGESFRSLEYQFPISRRTSFSRVISTDAYLKTPNAVAEWSLISEKFSQRWNFPNMIGAVETFYFTTRVQFRVPLQKL